MKIKDFAKETNFSIRMLRYLEDMGLVVPAREDNGYRIYNQDQIQTTKLIKKFQDLGFQLKEIKELISAEKKSLSIVKKVLQREQEIAEVKSDTIPVLKSIVQSLEDGGDVFTFFHSSTPLNKKLKTLGGEEKFHRTAYSIPILRNIYEDHLTIDSNINLIATDLMKFGEWFESIEQVRDVYSVLKESAFVFGHNLTDDFIQGYETAWVRFLPKMGFQKLNEFSKDDLKQLMGPHDIIIRSTFTYNDTGLAGEIVIPYTPIYTMSQLSHKR